MLETLDDSIFASLDDAYGPAVDVGPRLRRLAGDDLEDARAALSDLAAGIFHQGSYYPSAAPAVPFLIEIAGADVPIRAEVIAFLAEMSGIAEPEPFFDPYVFRSSPGAPDYPEAIATIEAIARGRATYQRALGAASADVRRAAVFLLSCLGGADLRDTFARALDAEDDDATRLTLVFATVRAGGALPALRGELERDVLAVLTQQGPLDDELAASCERLLRERLRTREELPFEGGDLVGLAARALERHASDPRSFEALELALLARLERGERIGAPLAPPPSRVCDEGPPPAIDFAGYGADAPLRVIATSMARVAFGARGAERRLLRREELDPRMRRVLELALQHRIPLPLPAVPWIDPLHLARFLRGGGPLDREVVIGGERAPAYELLAEVARTPKDPACAARVDAVIAALASQSTDDEAALLAIDLVEAPYGLPQHGLFESQVIAAIERHLGAALDQRREHCARYAETLVARESFTPAQARLALRHELARRMTPGPGLDRLARSVLAGRAQDPESLEWLRVFPEPRRSALVASTGNAWVIGHLRAACEERTLASALVERFLAPDCDWFVHAVDGALERVPTELLESARERASGRRAELLARILRARRGEGTLVLDLRAAGERVRATLVDWTGVMRFEGELSAQPRVEELAPIVECMRDVERPRVELAGDLDRTTRYRVQRLLAEAGLRGEIVDGRSSLSAAG